MTQDSKCFFGIHKYEIHQQIELTSKNGIETGTIIISRCANCGKIKYNYIDFSRNI